MYLIFECPCCLSQNIKFYPAHLAQFVVVRATGFPLKHNLPCQGLECNNCSFICSSLRLSLNELNNYYSDYNSESFYQHRIQFDSYFKDYKDYWKTYEFYNIRMSNINDILSRQPNLLSIKNILDFGGGEGLYFPLFLDKAEKYLYDINVKILPADVKKIDKSTEKKFDFIMCCHVLEHLSDPGYLVQEILDLSNDTTLFYFEVPDGDIEHGVRHQPNMEFHEHINLFNLKSLTTLLNRYGLTVIDSTNLNKNLGVLCSKQYNITQREN